MKLIIFKNLNIVYFLIANSSPISVNEARKKSPDKSPLIQKQKLKIYKWGKKRDIPSKNQQELIYTNLETFS